MAEAYRHIIVERHGNVACVSLAAMRYDEHEVHAMFNEILHLGLVEGRSRIALTLGPRPPECLYSIFIAKLLTLRRKLAEAGGGLKLCSCAPEVLDVLDACMVRDHFDIVADTVSARAQWDAQSG